MKGIINKFKNKLSVFTDTKEQLLAKQSYLQRGTYRLVLAGKRIAYLPSKEAEQFIEKNMTHMSRQSKVERLPLIDQVKQKVIQLLRIRINGDMKSTSTGSLVMFSRDNDLKIFDFKNNSVLTFLSSKEEFEQIKENFEQFRDYFLLTIKSYNAEELSYEEDYVDFIPYRHWSTKEKKACLHHLFRQYSTYVSEESKQSGHYYTGVDAFHTFKTNMPSNELVDRITRIINSEHELSQCRFPVIKQHGDLNFNNILLYDHLYYLIDWEDVDSFLFYYDLMNCLFVEAAFSDDYSYLYSYLDGELDDLFEDLFQAATMTFDCSKRMIYLAIYLCVRLISFEQIVHEQIIEDIYDKYVQVLRTIETYE